MIHSKVLIKSFNSIFSKRPPQIRQTVPITSFPAFPIAFFLRLYHFPADQFFLICLQKIVALHMWVLNLSEKIWHKNRYLTILHSFPLAPLLIFNLDFFQIGLVDFSVLEKLHIFTPPGIGGGYDALHVWRDVVHHQSCWPIEKLKMGVRHHWWLLENNFFFAGF